MPKCPECNLEIEELIEVSSQICRVSVTCHVDEVGDGWLEQGGISWWSNDDAEVIHYSCPKCAEAIFFGYQDAVDFLNTAVEKKEGRNNEIV